MICPSKDRNVFPSVRWDADTAYNGDVYSVKDFLLSDRNDVSFDIVPKSIETYRTKLLATCQYTASWNGALYERNYEFMQTNAAYNHEMEFWATI